MRSSSARLLALGLLPFAAAHVAAQSPDDSCVIGGTVAAGTLPRLPLPGVAILVAADGTEIAATSSDASGAYLVRVPSAGRYDVRAELAAFSPASREAVLTTEACGVRLDFTLTLLSRSTGGDRSPSPKAEPNAVAPIGGRGFQTVVPTATVPETIAALAEASTESERLDVPLPPGFSADIPTETVVMAGNQGQRNQAFSFDRPAEGFEPEEIQRRLAEAGITGGLGGRGGPGAIAILAGGGGGGGFGAGGPGGFGRLRGSNRMQATVTYTLGGSMFDARQYPLNGRAADRPDYVQQRYGATMGGPLKIPKIIDDGTRTSFFLNYGGNRSGNPVETYSTVPTPAQRSGDFSSSGVMLVDRTTGLPFAGNQIPGARLDPAARTLLPYIPLPNLPGDTLNFHYTTAVASTSDDVNARFVHVFGAEQTRLGRGGARGGGGGLGLGGRGGLQAERGGAGRGGAGRENAPPRSVLNVGINYRRSESVLSSTFPAIGGTTTGSGWNVPVGYLYSKGRFTNSLNVTFNRDRSVTRNLYAFARNVAGEAGIAGISQDPVDWGVPALSFTSVADLRDRNPSQRADRRLQIGDTVVRPVGRHVIRFGGEFRDMRLENQIDPNARGSFVFTGLYTSAVVGGRPVAGTGLDFADFLLGFAQQATVQYGPGRVRLRGRAWTLFLQDDWRARGNLTLNLGLRYEYLSPYVEAGGRLVNLDVAPGFTAAAPVIAGGVGAFTGAFPPSLVTPDRNNVGPRIGVAWKPARRTTVRAGYGINYNLGSYGSIAQQMTGQPPFAVTATSLGTPSDPLLLTNPFARVDRATTTNSYGIDRDYRLGLVQIWNVDLQRDLPRNLTASGGYTGTRGSTLDLQRAPNRGPTGLRIAGVQPFIWQSSEGRSIMHSFTGRARKRLARGIAAGGSYTWQRGFDNASSIGGGGTVVAQNDQDLDAEWGRSSFERRHTVSADYTFELPLGQGRRWLDHGGVAAVLFGDWAWSGNVSVQSGTPFTARVVGNVADVGRGVNGTLRADYNGAPIALDDPAPDRFFNTSAFSVPAAGQFGTAARNTITGPGSANVNMGLSKNVRVARHRGVTIRLQATNVLNSVRLSTIDTVVNSPTFGRVIGVRPMRSMQLTMRVRF